MEQAERKKACDLQQLQTDLKLMEAAGDEEKMHQDQDVDESRGSRELSQEFDEMKMHICRRWSSEISS